MKLNQKANCTGTDCKSAPAGGNVRSVIIENNNQPIVTQTNDYYPFGMVYQPQAMQEPEHRNKHLYNSKEEQEMPGKWLDYGARFYDAQIARFHSIDPLAEDYYPTSPYAYVANNPINAIDPDGREIWIITDRDSRGNAQQVQYREGNLYNEDGSDYEGDNEFALGLQSIFNALYALGDDFPLAGADLQSAPAEYQTFSFIGFWLHVVCWFHNQLNSIFIN